MQGVNWFIGGSDVYSARVNVSFWRDLMLQTEQGGKRSVGRVVMLQTVKWGKGSFGRDVKLQNCKGKGTVGET